MGPHPTPQKHDSPNANPNGTAQQTADLTKRCACAAKCITFLARHVGVMQITMELRRKLTRDTSMQSHLQKLPPMAANLRRDDDDTTTTNDDKRRHDASHANTAPTPRPPTINGNPSLRIREKRYPDFAPCGRTRLGLSSTPVQRQIKFRYVLASLRT